LLILDEQDCLLIGGTCTGRYLPIASLRNVLERDSNCGFRKGIRVKSITYPHSEPILYLFLTEASE
jgi:hypothetical protein